MMNNRMINFIYFQGSISTWFAHLLYHLYKTLRINTCLNNTLKYNLE